MSLALLSKLTPNSVSLTPVVKGGKAEISMNDVSAALAYGNLPKPVVRYAWAKYCDDSNSAILFQNETARDIQVLIDDNDWQDSVGRASNIASLLFQEAVIGKVCKSCKGRGLIWKKSEEESVLKTISCEICAGTGHGRISERKRALICGIPSTSWQRTWRIRYENLLTQILAYDDVLNRHLKNQFNRM